MNKEIHIMVIDDEPIVGKRLKTVLEKDGYAVDIYTEGAAALRELASGRFHIVITDLKMEGIDGMQILEQVKSTSPDIKVIVITGYGRRATAREALNRGAFEFLTKPFKIEELRQVIKRAESGLRSQGQQETSG